MKVAMLGLFCAVLAFVERLEHIDNDLKRLTGRGLKPWLWNVLARM